MNVVSITIDNQLSDSDAPNTLFDVAPGASYMTAGHISAGALAVPSRSRERNNGGLYMGKAVEGAVLYRLPGGASAVVVYFNLEGRRTALLEVDARERLSGEVMDRVKKAGEVVTGQFVVERSIYDYKVCVGARGGGIWAQVFLLDRGGRVGRQGVHRDHDLLMDHISSGRLYHTTPRFSTSYVSLALTLLVSVCHSGHTTRKSSVLSIILAVLGVLANLVMDSGYVNDGAVDRASMPRLSYIAVRTTSVL